VFDVESLSHLCRLLYTHEAALDILAIHVKIYDIIFRALLFLEQYDCETVGRDSSSYSGSSALTMSQAILRQLSPILGMLYYLCSTQYLASMHVSNYTIYMYADDLFQLETRTFTLEGKTLSASYLTANDIVQPVENLSGDDAVAFSAWFKALFDSSSEGIEDGILR
jgi:mediator of RNA polymerase II transcription subunit 5